MIIIHPNKTYNESCICCFFFKNTKYKTHNIIEDIMHAYGLLHMKDYTYLFVLE